jgi:hypothetical protein
VRARYLRTAALLVTRLEPRASAVGRPNLPVTPARADSEEDATVLLVTIGMVVEQRQLRPGWAVAADSEAAMVFLQRQLPVADPRAGECDAAPRASKANKQNNLNE